MDFIYKKLIEDELRELELSLNDSISSDIQLATEVSNYLVGSGGKRIRPALCILVARSLDYSGKDLIRLASSIELLHTATLIHDDVVDESLTRRGKESIHTKWDNAHGVLVGDFVYSKAFQLMASFENPEIIRTLADATNRISEGEVLQLTLKNQSILSEKDYFEVIDRKTAELFKVSAITAGILCSSKDTQLSSLSNFAKSLGIAFQIQDDILDYFGEEKLTGKKIGKDFEEGKFTLPIIIALKESTEENQNTLLSLFKKGEREDFPKVLALINKANTLEKAEEVFLHYTKECMKELNHIPQNDYKIALEDIVSNLGSRLT